MIRQRAIVLILLLAQSYAHAHTRSESYSQWYLTDNGISSVVTIAAREITRLPGYQGSEQSLPELFASHLSNTVSVFATAGECGIRSSGPLESAAGFVRIESIFDCGDQQPHSISYRAMFEAAPSHVHYARLYRNTELLAESLITDTSTTWIISGGENTGNRMTVGAFLALGVEHISGGFDHIAFLIGLLLVAGTFRLSIVAITGFTVGHSVSLAAAVLGFVSADARLVEAFIGFTVALIALEYFLLRQNDIRAAAWSTALMSLGAGFIALIAGTIGASSIVAFAGIGLFASCYLLLLKQSGSRGKNPSLLFVATCTFGLIHGFGFAGFLMDSGVLGTRLIAPLFGFNIGVEIGQFAIVVVVLLITRLTRSHIPAVVPQIVAASLCGLGIYWFASRSFA